MIAIAGWLLWQQRNHAGAKPALFFYGIQLLMNWAWTPIFFQFHLIQLGFYWIIGIALATLITILIAWNKFKVVGVMLIPYWFWLVFASYLNGIILANN
jgi:tryptophan-rich sensory protein